MAKYIDANKLIHDLEERIYAYSEGYAEGDDNRKDAIETLLKDVKYQYSLQQEQPEVDLEVRKQIEELANDWHHKGFASDEDCPLCMQDLMDILWHFYELGRKQVLQEIYDCKTKPVDKITAAWLDDKEEDTK